MNIAILIDAENVLPSHADTIFNHAMSLGTVTRKEIYGAAQALTTWVAPVLKYAIHPNLTIKASKGKNSSDIALVIGAMDLLLAGSIETVIIASSDSDFSALSVRLRNAGVEVIGMGTEKSNELWRTACSTFMVLQQNGKAPKADKPDAPAPQPAKAQKADKQPAQSRRGGRTPKADKPVAATHAERVAVIRAAIERELSAHGGRLQVSNLFPELNKVPEYKVDKQGAGKKPLNYLISVYGDAFRFEETPDGQNWVSLPDAPAETGAAPAPETAPEAEAIVAPAEPEAAPEAPAQPEPEAPEAEPEAPEAEPAEDPLAKLLDAGIPEDVAGRIVEIFTESDNLRDAYNRLRTTFGNTAGREYYQRVKEIAEAR